MDRRHEGAACFPASCFGKLPAFGDFVRHNAGGRDLVAFDQWLQQGLHYARARLGGGWDDAFRRAPAYHFLFFPENAESFLLGLLRPSHDRSERRFPFVVALRVDRRLPPDLVPLSPVVFAPFLERAGALAREVSRDVAPPGVGEATARLQTPVAQDYAAVRTAYRLHLTGTSVGDLWRCLWGRPDDARARLVFRNLLETLVPLRGRNPERLALGLRFPLAGDASTLAFLVSFWLDAAFQVAGANGARPFLFWTAPSRPAPAAPSGAHLYAFMRQPTVRSVLHLLRPDLDSDFICPMDTPDFGAPAAERAALPPRLDAMLSDTGTSLARLLDALAVRRPGATARPGGSC